MKCTEGTPRWGPPPSLLTECLPLSNLWSPFWWIEPAMKHIPQTNFPFNTCNRYKCCPYQPLTVFWCRSLWEKNYFWIVVNSDENPKMWAVEYGCQQFCSFSLLLKTCDIWLFCTVSKPINFHVCIESLDCCFAHLDTKGDEWEPIDENALSD